MKALLAALAVAIATPALAEPPAPPALPAQPSPDPRFTASAVMLRYDACMSLVQDPTLRKYGITVDTCLRMIAHPVRFDIALHPWR